MRENHVESLTGCGVPQLRSVAGATEKDTPAVGAEFGVEHVACGRPEVEEAWTVAQESAEAHLMQQIPLRVALVILPSRSEPWERAKQVALLDVMDPVGQVEPYQPLAARVGDALVFRGEPANRLDLMFLEFARSATGARFDGPTSCSPRRSARRPTRQPGPGGLTGSRRSIVRR